jgi:hypothetical protein
MRAYYQQLYTNKFNNLDEKGKLLEEDILKKLTQNETVYLNSPISIK